MLSGTLVETSSAYSDFLLCKKSVIRSTVSPLRKKYHSVQLLVCKRTRNAELSLTTFCGFWISLRKKSVDRSAVLPLRKKSRSAQLFAYKCAHTASLSLPTFCGYCACSRCLLNGRAKQKFSSTFFKMVAYGHLCRCIVQRLCVTVIKHPCLRFPKAESRTAVRRQRNTLDKTIFEGYKGNFFTKKVSL